MRRKIWTKARARLSYSPRTARFATNRRRAWPRPAESSGSILSCVNTTQRARNRLARWPPTLNQWTAALAAPRGRQSDLPRATKRRNPTRRKNRTPRQVTRQGQAGEQKGTGKKPEAGAETNSSESKPAETKPSEAKPSEAKPSEAKPSDAKSSDGRPADIVAPERKSDTKSNPPAASETKPAEGGKSEKSD